MNSSHLVRIPLLWNIVVKIQEVATTFSFWNKDKVSDAMNSNEEPSKNVKALDFVSCYYDNYWWIGLVLGKMTTKKIHVLNSCIPMGQVHHLCGFLSRIFAGYQITTSCVNLIVLLQKHADLMLFVKLTLQIFYQKLAKPFVK